MKKTISMMMALAVAGTMAVPAMAVNDEPMVIAPAPNAQSQQAQMKIVVKGKTMPVQTISVNGCTMAPVRAIAEALGFKVTWNADRSININNGEMQSDLRIGDNSYVVYTAVEGMAGMSAPFSLGSRADHQEQHRICADRPVRAAVRQRSGNRKDQRRHHHH